MRREMLVWGGDRISSRSRHEPLEPTSSSSPTRADARGSDKEGTPDRFVIRIWAPGADPDTTDPIYKASGDVEGGQVVIHRE